MSVYSGPNLKMDNKANIHGIVVDQLQIFYDSARSFSYSGTGAIWRDLSDNSRDLTLYNAGGVTYSLTTAGPPSYSDESLGVFTFDGSNDWGKFSQYTFPANVSVSAWVKTTSSAGGKGLVSNCSGGPVGLVYGIDSGKMWYYYYTTSWQTALSTSTINDGNWKNIVWTKSGTSMKMYINGALDATVTLTGNVMSLMNCVGSGWGTCNSDSYGAGTDSYGMVFPGSIAMLMVHSKELSQAEISINYANTKRRFGY